MGNKTNHPTGPRGRYKPFPKHKVCGRCGKRKPASQFATYMQDNIKYLQSSCKVCQSSHARNNRDSMNKYRAESIARLKKEAVLYKGGKCSRCGKVFPVFCYDFHHVDPSTKISTVARLMERFRRFAAIRDELDKCILVCANCHRIIEYTKDGES